jgi:hypothetical protein
MSKKLLEFFLSIVVGFTPGRVVEPFVHCSAAGLNGSHLLFEAFIAGCHLRLALGEKL